MRRFQFHRGVAVPLPIDDLNTDVIIPTARAVTAARGQLGRHAFEPLRYRPDGTEDPAFSLNQPRFRNASILIGGANFGCGSSREMAVWALWELGFRCVVAPSFGDIFHANCCRNGLLPAVLDGASIASLTEELEHRAPPVLEIDLETRTLGIPAETRIRFGIEDGRRQALLDGLDDIASTNLHRAAITHWLEHDRAERPWLHQPSNG